jgi:hypothetical protein
VAPSKAEIHNGAFLSNAFSAVRDCLLAQLRNQARTGTEFMVNLEFLKGAPRVSDPFKAA